MIKNRKLNSLKRLFFASAIFAPIVLSSCTDKTQNSDTKKEGGGSGEKQTPPNTETKKSGGDANGLETGERENPDKTTPDPKKKEETEKTPKVEMSTHSFELANKFDEKSIKALRNVGTLTLTINGGNFNLTSFAAIRDLAKKKELPSTNTFGHKIGMLLQKVDFENFLKAITVDGKGLKAANSIPEKYQKIPGSSKIYSAKAVDEDAQPVNGQLDLTKSYTLSGSNFILKENKKSVEFTLTITKFSSWSVKFENIEFTNVL
ncbi:hypothetical protein [Mycoplasma sp. E35C]|uniref:hypothetical protein n=1 Tax=Mycoplasma sp. E35C TaxID=2801918 RepID=UPI001CA3F59D|nr:hypothetical protein [Mycoplasma sp. E35C]QZX48822.1 hypothetical protein JJE79_02055 [Mycoplasma sp. E35C]